MSLRCGVTKKVCFRTEQGAINRGAEIVDEETNRRFTPQSFRAYHCLFCGGYHLTGKVLNYVERPRR